MPSLEARIRHRVNAKIKRHAKVAAGLCAFCPNVRVSYGFLCDPCEAEHRQKQRKYVAGVIVGVRHGPPRPPELQAKRKAASAKKRYLAGQAVRCGGDATEAMLDALISLRYPTMPQDAPGHD